MAEKNAMTRDYLARNAFPLIPGARGAIDDFSALDFQSLLTTSAYAITLVPVFRYPHNVVLTMPNYIRCSCKSASLKVLS
jgi:hypothetical protein